MSHELEEITGYVQQHIDSQADVDRVEEIFQIGISDQCKLANDEIIARLASKFPRCIFGIRRWSRASQEAVSSR